MIKTAAIILCFISFNMLSSKAWAGPYPPAAEETGSHAVHMDDLALVYWANGYADYVVGDNVDGAWQIPQNALGKAQGTSFDVVVLGDGGRITLMFDPPIENGEGWDFAVFENSITDTYLELAYVEISSNGNDFLRLDNVSLTANPVPGFGSLDPTDVDGLAGKYRQGYGTPFDLDVLSTKDEVVSGLVDLSAVTHVRIVDIVGDGTFLDSSGSVIYDPYPNTGSAGFDLDAVGVSNGAPYPEEEYTPPEIPTDDDEAGFGNEIGCFVGNVIRNERPSSSSECGVRRSEVGSRNATRTPQSERTFITKSRKKGFLFNSLNSTPDPATHTP